MNVLRDLWHPLFLVGFVVFIAIRSRYARQMKKRSTIHRQIDLQERVLLISVIGGNAVLPLLYLVTPLLSFADYRRQPFAQGMGVAVMLASLWLFWRSHADLGRNWSVSLELRESHSLVTRGVYTSIRHPMYAAIWLWGIAQVLMLPNWVAGPSTLLPFAFMYFLRTPVEERMMLKHFGQAYCDYMDRTGRLIPRLFSRPSRVIEAGTSTPVPAAERRPLAVSNASTEATVNRPSCRTPPSQVQ